MSACILTRDKGLGGITAADKGAHVQLLIRIILALAILSGCGGGSGGDAGGGGSGDTGGGDTGGGDTGGGGGDGEVDPRLTRLGNYEAQKTRVLGDPATGVTGIAPTLAMLPDQGTMQFSGFATLRLEGPLELVMSGDAVVNVNFASQQISGEMDKFFGTLPNSGIADYAGRITITGGHVQQDLSLDYAGALSGGGQDLVLSGRLVGAFLGDPVRALAAADLDPTVLQNGQVRTGTLLLVAEQVFVPP